MGLHAPPKDVQRLGACQVWQPRAQLPISLGGAAGLLYVSLPGQGSPPLPRLTFKRCSAEIML